MKFSATILILATGAFAAIAQPQSSTPNPSGPALPGPTEQASKWCRADVYVSTVAKMTMTARVATVAIGDIIAAGAFILAPAGLTMSTHNPSEP
ncbi:hypothetical protein N7541_005414 [Penicillium brevicompactum]|uniref:Uncharacterized protein n=1 Tax=Penicillium brevicompactum TaxID=5074 RepID=A0A9W9UXB4_PENBR|nr:hypothetical protein N7541_005414 [Penicillium brevicompactum]